jgi:hypothetical protein
MPRKGGGLMSRGPGRWQRLLLHELYHNPKPPTLGYAAPWIYTRSFAATDSEYSAIRRAARGLIANGWAHSFHGWAHSLIQVDPAPDIPCPQCGRKCSEVVQSDTARNTYAQRRMSVVAG